MANGTVRGVLLLSGSLLLTPLAAMAQAPGDTIQPRVPAGQQAGVIKPPTTVDPGMTRGAPTMPSQSMPVIHPRQLHKGRHGTVEVVPK